MSGRKDDDKFSMPVPEDESERQMPDHLELVDDKGGKPKKRLHGGAYDPYQKQDPGGPGDTARIRKPRVDLRKLSEWIKTTQRVKTRREEDPATATPEPDRDGKPRK